jgi:hypothetical protein
MTGSKTAKENARPDKSTASKSIFRKYLAPLLPPLIRYPPGEAPMDRGVNYAPQ